MNTNLSVSQPKSETELLKNAKRITGKTLSQLAGLVGITAPDNQKRAKGWSGEIVETLLGASASSLPEPDFQLIGVELKTIPINKKGRPKESTYVTTVPLTKLHDLSWENSNVKLKLSRVLWVPIESDPSIPLPKRRIGDPILWSPTEQQENDIRTDWEELMGMINLGELDRISSRLGKVLQIRPKAANARALVQSINESGELGLSLPRGFYLRSSFTHSILSNL